MASLLAVWLVVSIAGVAVSAGAMLVNVRHRQRRMVVAGGVLCALWALQASLVVWLLSLGL